MTVADLKKYKDSLYSSLSRDLDAFEKNFILVSTGILAFSITFIKDIVKIDEASCLIMLFAGWLLILIAIGLMMFTFLSSVNGSNELWKIVDTYLVDNNKFNPEDALTVEEALSIKTTTNNSFFKIKKRLKRLRTVAIYSFLFGVFFFSSFVAINLTRENEKDKSIKIENQKRAKIIIKAGNTETSTNDSLIIIKN